ncbi:MAG: hypothetical protein KDD58_13345 [Bdellovibrionales bacterium]|nr:hypothetical protein [Bdellovibrionales bacterium]
MSPRSEARLEKWQTLKSAQHWVKKCQTLLDSYLNPNQLVCLHCKKVKIKSRHTENINKFKNQLPFTWHELPSSLRERELINKYKTVLFVLSNTDAFLQWAIELREETFKKFYQANPQTGKKQHLPDHTLKFFLDQVITDRAKKYGFQLDSSQQPYLLREFSRRKFYNLIKEGYLFLDVAGANMEAIGGHPQLNALGLTHGEYSHALQILFLAEYIPEFVRLYKTFGFKNNQKAWAQWLDNPETFGVTNPAVFQHYTFEILNNYN